MVLKEFCYVVVFFVSFERIEEDFSLVVCISFLDFFLISVNIHLADHKQIVNVCQNCLKKVLKLCKTFIVEYSFDCLLSLFSQNYVLVKNPVSEKHTLLKYPLMIFVFYI